MRKCGDEIDGYTKVLIKFGAAKKAA